MVKPNFNSPDPFPGSTDLEFLRCVLQILQEAGAKVLVGESAGGMWRPILNQKGDGLCPMEGLSLGKTPEEFYRLLRGKAVS